jgi:hypothetical protein
MKTLLACVLFLGFLGTSGPAPAAEKPWVVLPIGETKTILMQCSRSVPQPGEPFWSPTPAQIEELEKRLPAYLRQQRHAEHADQLSKSLRQYVGITVEGRKVIYLNAFHPDVLRIPGCKPSEGKDCQLPWHQRAIQVCDGGDDFWGVEYDPESKTFNGLAFNGVA